MLYRANDGIKMTLAHSFEEEANSFTYNKTEVIIPLKPSKYTYDKEDFKFIEAINKQLFFFDNIDFIGFPDNNIRTIKTLEESIKYEDDNFLFCNNTTNKLLINKVSYPLDTSIIKTLDKFNGVGLNLKFNIGELDLVPSRESIRYTEDTIKRINDKIALLLAISETKFVEAMQSAKDLSFIDKLVLSHDLERLTYVSFSSAYRHITSEATYWAYLIIGFTKNLQVLIDNNLLEHDGYNMYNLLDLYELKNNIPGFRKINMIGAKNAQSSIGYICKVNTNGYYSDRVSITSDSVKLYSSSGNHKYNFDVEKDTHAYKKRIYTLYKEDIILAKENIELYVDTLSLDVDVDDKTLIENFTNSPVVTPDMSEEVIKRKAIAYKLFKKYFFSNLTKLSTIKEYEDNKITHIKRGVTDSVYYRYLIRQYTNNDFAFKETYEIFKDLEEKQENNRLFIYGFSEDDSYLKQLGAFLSANRYLSSELFKEFSIIKIAQENEKYFIKNSIYCKDLIKMRHELIRNVYTAHKLGSIYSISFIGNLDFVFPNLSILFKKVAKFYNNYRSNALNKNEEFLALCEDYNLVNQDILTKFEVLKDFSKDIMLLQSVNCLIRSYGNCSEDEKILITEFLVKNNKVDIEEEKVEEVSVETNKLIINQ